MENFKKYLSWGIIGTTTVLLSTEAIARYHLGLGKPPISITHPEIEYLFKPNQEVTRFGNLFKVNQYSMRSEPLPETKGSDEQRLMIFGDSVVNGGAPTDHSDLATTLINEHYKSSHSQPTYVGNISAGSWGPGNWKGYIDTFGFFDADTIVLVISSHDAADVPTFSTLNENTHPTKNPPSALSEAFTRYLPRLINLVIPSSSKPTPPKPHSSLYLRALADLKTFLDKAQLQTKRVIVFQHWEKAELAAQKPRNGYQLIKNLAEKTGVQTVSLAPYLQASLDRGEDPYSDNIHLNTTGQTVLANAIIENLKQYQ